jgi:hypothetical protein
MSILALTLRSTPLSLKVMLPPFWTNVPVPEMLKPEPQISGKPKVALRVATGKPGCNNLPVLLDSYGPDSDTNPHAERVESNAEVRIE